MALQPFCQGMQDMKTICHIALVGLTVLAPTYAARAIDPPGYTAPFGATVDTLNLPLLALLRAAPGWAPAMRDDQELVALGFRRANRVRAAADCTAKPGCLADAWRWTTSDIDTVEASLRRIMARPGVAQALVTTHLRPSGRFGVRRFCPVRHRPTAHE